MKLELTLSVNGDPHQIRTDPGRMLLEVLREDLRLTGTKYGCGEGQCRACTVLIDGHPNRACLTPVTFAEGKSVLTIEGLANGDELNPTQQAFIDEGAMQCGYCVPGMIMSATALLEQNPDPTDEEIVRGMNGNICRCCGYPNILKAVRRAAQSGQEAVSK